ncbi:MAG: hypothetical protein ACPGU1_05100 [Myxococcota bacterium]
MEHKLLPALLATVIGASLALTAPDALACSCFPPNLAQQVDAQDHVFRARIRGPEILFQGDRWYRARVQRTYKGCLKRGDLVLLKTPSSGAACGMQLSTKTTYLVTAQDDGPFYGSLVLSFGSCGYTRAWSSVSSGEKTYLKQRYNCCGESCACADDSAPVQCFADPCQVTSCPVGTCVSNMCGGCNAEYSLDSGVSVCEACAEDSDCPWGQGCSTEGICLPTCTSDEDCGDSAWCRSTQAGGQLCTAYQQEGDHCGGYTPSWALTKCAPNLVCADVPTLIPDAPGVCRRPCTSTADCDTGSYCDTAGLCRESGACQSADDCSLDDNVWPHAQCIGYATCNPFENTCAWQCGEGPTCMDLGAVAFGFCDAVIGYGVVNNDCVLISGCDAQGYPLFDDLPDCYETCLPGQLPK